MRKINVVIPAAGLGERFVKEGFKKPKPLIRMGGRSMLQRVISNVKDLNDFSLHIVLNDKQYKNNKHLFDEFLPKDCSISFVDKENDGAVCSIFACSEFINNDEELIILNSDQQLSPGLLFKFVESMRNKQAGAGIITFLEKKGARKWSYASVVDDKIIDVAEKFRISNYATVGVYYFNKGKDFITAATKMISLNDRTNNEFYLAPVYNYLNKGIFNYTIEEEEFACFGTPEDYRTFCAEGVLYTK